MRTPGESAVRGDRPFRRLLRFGRPYLSKIALSLLLILVAMSIQLMLPIGIRAIFDDVFTSGNLRYAHWVAAGLLLFFAFRSVLSYISQYVLQRIGDIVIVDLRNALFGHYQRLDIGFFHQNRIGDLLSRMTNDVTAIRNLVSGLSISMSSNLFQLLGATGLMMWMNWRLGLIVLATSPMVTWVTYAFAPFFARYAARIQDELATSSSVAQESLSGIEVAKAFGRGDFEAGRYARALQGFLRVSDGARKADSLFSAVVGFVTSFSSIAIFWYGGLEVMEGRITAGTLVAFLLYSQNVTQGIAGLAQHVSSYSQAVGASRRVFEILDTEIEQEGGDDALVLDTNRAEVVFDNVRFRYREDVPLIEGIGFVARPGETVALVGASGSGKSTLLKLIPRFYDVDAGAVLVNGRNVRDYTRSSLRNAISIVSQDVFLFGTSIRENIRYGRLDATDAEIEAAACAANAHEFIERQPEGYETLVGERGVQLSGGQRQRIAIARALLRDAPILILDEATSAIDIQSEALIQEAVERLKSSRTTFVIAHRESTIRNADLIVTMAEGRAIATRPSSERSGRDDAIGHSAPVVLQTAKAIGMH